MIRTRRRQAIIVKHGRRSPRSVCTGSMLLLAAVFPAEGGQGDERVHAVLVEGTGVYSRPIVTSSPRAQAFFDQGLRLTWGYYFPDAAASFQEAARLDPDNPMIQWGLALAISPNPNSRYLGFADDPQGSGKAAIQRAKARAGDASARDRAFIDALHVRYDDDAIPDRAARDAAYLQQARMLAERYPDDPDAVAVYADAAMTSTPWIYWDEHGQPVSGDITNALQLLEANMEKRPDHPGTNHLYLHIIESSPTPERALPQADRLESLMPTAGHIVHMPSHIYVRTGQYRKAIESNQRSLAADERFLAAWGNRPFPMEITSHKLSAAIHAWHAQDFIRYSASVQGNYDNALKAARTAASIAVRDQGPNHGRSQLAVAAIWQIHKMFGKWDAVLSEPAPPGTGAYRDAVIAYAKGSAYVGRGDVAAAGRELARVRAAAENLKGLKISGMANLPDDLLAIALAGLEGEIVAARGEVEDAIAAFERAVELQDRLRYIEPPDWPLSMRLYLGEALLRAERPARAEQVFRQELKWHQNNGWALHGLHLALRAQGKDRIAVKVEHRFEQAWRQADVAPSAAHF